QLVVVGKQTKPTLHGRVMKLRSRVPYDDPPRTRNAVRTRALLEDMPRDAQACRGRLATSYRAHNDRDFRVVETKLPRNRAEGIHSSQSSPAASGSGNAISTPRGVTSFTTPSG